MSHLTTVAQQSWPDEEEHVGVTSVDLVRTVTAHLQRAVDFYSRVFGFSVVDDRRAARYPYVVMRAGSVHLAICGNRESTRAATPTNRWSFVVPDIDRAREIVWNLGLATADRSDAPRRSHAWRASRSFMIRDPDGNEIELVERPNTIHPGPRPVPAERDRDPAS